MVLQAYFDESGTGGTERERLTVISGFIAKAENWLDFDAFWRLALRQELKELGLSWFHMVDCENGSDGFRRWAAKPELRRFAARTMAEAIVKAELTGFWVSVDAESWRNADDVAFKARYPKPYYFCFEDSVRQVARWVNEFAPGEEVELIFAEQGEYKVRAEGIYDDIQRAYALSKPDFPLKNLSFAPMQRCAPLQAADLAVYSTNKQMDSSLYDKDTCHRIYQAALDVLYENPASFTGSHYDTISLPPIVEMSSLWGQSS